VTNDATQELGFMAPEVSDSSANGVVLEPVPFHRIVCTALSLKVLPLIYLLLESQFLGAYHFTLGILP